MIKLLIFGPTGSMGKLVGKLALEDKDIDVAAYLTGPGLDSINNTLNKSYN